MHGHSAKAPPPHTVSACATDVLALIDSESARDRNVGCILGHSFGGKVALAMRQQREKLAPLWLIDSGPSAHPEAMQDSANTVVAVLRMLEDLPAAFASREAFVEDVMSRGFLEPLARWLAMNLERCDGGFRSSLDPEAMSNLLSDYFSLDLWSVVEDTEHAIHVAVATRGSTISSQDRERFMRCDNVQVHDIEGGHWLHVDALATLVEQVGATLE